MENDKRSNQLFTYNILGTVILHAVSAISAPVFSRMLGAENYGAVQIYSMWVSFFSYLVGMGTNGTLEIARTHYLENEQRGYQSCALTVSMASFGIVAVIVLAGSRWLLPFFGMDFPFMLLMLFHSFGMFCVSFLNAKFTVEFRAKGNFIVAVAIALANVGLSWILLKTMPQGDYTGRIVGMALPYIAALFAIAAYILRQGRVIFNKRYYRFCIPLGFPLVFHGVAGIVCNWGDRLMISRMLDNSAVGIYSLAYSFAGIMDAIRNAMQKSWSPLFYEYFAQGRQCELKTRAKNYLRLFACITAGFLLLSPEVYRIYASNEFWAGVNVIPIVVLGIFAEQIYIFAANYEFAMGKTHMVAAATVSSGGLNVILNLFFIRRWGYVGAGLATMLTFSFNAAAHFFFAKRTAEEKWIYPCGFFAPYIAMELTVTAFYYIFCGQWLIRWGLGGVLGIYMIYHIIRQKAIF